MVGHQAVTRDLRAMPASLSHQQIQVEAAMIQGVEYGLAIVTALRHMVGDSRNNDTSPSRHKGEVAGGGESSRRKCVCPLYALRNGFSNELMIRPSRRDYFAGLLNDGGNPGTDRPFSPGQAAPLSTISLEGSFHSMGVSRTVIQLNFRRYWINVPIASPIDIRIILPDVFRLKTTIGR